MTVNDIKFFETEALTLPANKRAILAKHLLESLDNLDEKEIEKLWFDEADRRYQAYKQGSIPSRDAFEAIADARKQL